MMHGLFGSLALSMLTMFQVVSGGMDWGDAFQAVQLMGPLPVMIFLFFIVFWTFAALNLVTALLVDSTMQRAGSERDFVIQTEMEAKKDFIEAMLDIFQDLDRDNNGSISLPELQKHFLSEEVATYFSALDLNAAQAGTLFELIDTNGDQAICQDEFIWGCLRLKGNAKSLDIATLHCEVKCMHSLMHSMHEALDLMSGHSNCSFKDVPCPGAACRAADRPESV